MPGHVHNVAAAGRRTRLALAALLLLFGASGATCQRQWLRPIGSALPGPPQVLPPGAPLPDILAAVNRNTSRVHSLTATSATITIPDAVLLPPLRTNLALQRPRRFRLTAETTFTSKEVDLGSNDELFWVWMKRNQQPAVYVCRHDQFSSSAAHRVMPIEPEWLHSALGLTTLDPNAPIQGPIPHGDGTIEIRMPLDSAAGTLNRVLVIDPQRALVLQQHVYDASGTTLIASAVASSHRYYPIEQVSLPESVAIQLPTVQLAMTIHLGTVQINTLPPPTVGVEQPMFVLPAFPGAPQVDLGSMRSGTMNPAPFTPQPQFGPQPQAETYLQGGTLMNGAGQGGGNPGQPGAFENPPPAYPL